MAAKSKTVTTKRWWEQSRRDASLLAAVALVAAYALTSRAIDTGSLGQYALVLVLLVLFFNRVAMAIRPAK